MRHPSTDQKIRDTLRALQVGRTRLEGARTLTELLRATRVPVDTSILLLSSVRAAMTALRGASQRRAAVLTAALVTRFQGDPHSLDVLRQVQEALRTCCGPFPREATTLRQLLETDRGQTGESVTPA